MGSLLGTVRVLPFFRGDTKFLWRLTDESSLVWYFFNDVYPSLHDGHRPFDPPAWWRRIFEGRPVDSDAAPIVNDLAAAGAPEVR